MPTEKFLILDSSMRFLRPDVKPTVILPLVHPLEFIKSAVIDDDYVVQISSPNFVMPDAVRCSL